MSQPLTYTDFLTTLRSTGLRVVEIQTDGKSPAQHNREGHGPWGPVHGVMIHHTVTRGTPATVEMCRIGYPGLPGPLCHGVIAKDGTVYVVGYGRTNHAGAGDRDVFNAVVRESYASVPPKPDKADMDGNARFYGFECENYGDGKDPWPDAQLAAIEKVSAALCKAHGWGERSVIGHLEWQPGKVDPRGFAMAGMRVRVRNRLTGKVPASSAPTVASLDKRVQQLEATVKELLQKVG